MLTLKSWVRAPQAEISLPTHPVGDLESVSLWFVEEFYTPEYNLPTPYNPKHLPAPRSETPLRLHKMLV